MGRKNGRTEESSFPSTLIREAWHLVLYVICTIFSMLNDDVPHEERVVGAVSNRTKVVLIGVCNTYLVERVSKTRGGVVSFLLAWVAPSSVFGSMIVENRSLKKRKRRSIIACIDTCFLMESAVIQALKDPLDEQDAASLESIFKARSLHTSTGRRNGRTEKSRFGYRFGGCGILHVPWVSRKLFVGFSREEMIVSVLCRVEQHEGGCSSAFVAPHRELCRKREEASFRAHWHG